MFSTKKIIGYSMAGALFFILVFIFSVDVNCRTCIGHMDPMRQMIGDGGDTYEFFGFHYMVRDNLLSGRLPLADSTILHYPVGVDFNFAFEGIFHTLFGGFISMFIDSVLSYNLTIIAILFLNLFLSALCFYRIGDLANPGQREHVLIAKSILAAAIFGYSAYVAVRFNGHLNLALVPGFPYLLMAMVNLYMKIRRSVPLTAIDLIHFPSSFLLLSIASVGYVFFAFLTLPAYMLFFWKIRFETARALFNLLRKPANLAIVVFGSLFILGIFIVMFHGFFWAIAHGEIFIPKRETAIFDVVDVLKQLVIPNTYEGTLWRNLNLLRGGITNSIFLGYSTLMVFVSFFAFTKKRHWILPVLLILLYIVFFMSGIIKFPIVYQTLRFYIFLILLASTLLVADDMSGRKFLFILFFVITAERMLIAPQVTRLLNDDLLRTVQVLEGEGVMVAPMSPFSTFHSMLPYYFQKSVMDGNVHWTGLTDKTLTYMHDPELTFFRCISNPPFDPPTALSRLKSLDVHTIVFDGFSTTSWIMKDCAPLLQWLARMTKAGYLEIIKMDGTITIYRIV